MHVTLDNAFAFSILILILITIMSYIIPSAHVSFTTIKEHQLEEVAQSIMDKILLSPGIPENWGDIKIVNSENDLKVFGLQKVNGSLYELDVDKILRINSVNISTSVTRWYKSGKNWNSVIVKINRTVTLPETIRISPDKIAELLGLGKDYGFSIRITPALNISVYYNSYYDFSNGHGEGQGWLKAPNPIIVTVKTPEGRPALGANVTGLFMMMSIVKEKGEEEYNISYTYLTSITDWEGKAILDFKNFLDDINTKLKNKVLKNSGYSIVVYADYYGIRAVNSSLLETDLDEVLNGMVVDNYLILEHGLEKHAAAHLGESAGLANPPYYIYLSYFENVTEHGESGWIINHGNYRIRVYELANVVDDDVSLILVSAKYTGKYRLFSFFREPSNVICQKGVASGNIKTSVLRRMVRVGSFHYIVEVRVWRWGEG
ncbi:MAG: hypothetical protein QW734_10990 [Candidatus Bathyarchaeia archaeon]